MRLFRRSVLCGFVLPQRELNFHLQSASLAITRGEVTTVPEARHVERSPTLGRSLPILNREIPKCDKTARTGGGVHSREHRNHGRLQAISPPRIVVCRLCSRQESRRSVVCVANRIAHDVLNAASQQGGIANQPAIVCVSDDHRLVVLLAFKTSIFGGAFQN